MVFDSNAAKYDQQLQETRQLWDSAAATFDDQPDHGLRDPKLRAAWIYFLKMTLPSSKSMILDIGCGTGSLSVVLAELGHDVTGIDLSPEMIALAEAKARATRHPIKFYVMDAAFPEFSPHHFDMIVCRHLLWTLPEPDYVLERWVDLLKPGGRLLLIEGYWHTGAGLHAEEITEKFPASISRFSVQDLSDQSALWGKKIDDERYAIIADL